MTSMESALSDHNYTNSGYVYKHPKMHHDKRTSLQTA